MNESSGHPKATQAFAWHLLALLSLLSVLTSAWAEERNWPQFRGPRGDGSSLNTGLPINWGTNQNVRWSTPIEGKAWSSPVIWDRQLWLTTATEDGRELSVICIDPESGKPLITKSLFKVDKPQAIHTFNSYGSPTPVIEQGRIYVSFGSPGTACLDTRTGQVLWERRDFECNHFRGAGSSPIIFGDSLFLNFDGSDKQYVVALDKHTGKTLWSKNRSIDFQDLGPDGKPEGEGDLRKAFATCQVMEGAAPPVLLSPGSRAIYAYEPQTGDELWRLEERTSYSGCGRPVLGNHFIYIQSGFASGQLLAIRPGKKGEVLDAKETTPRTQLQLAWRVKKNVPKKPSLLLSGDLLFGIEDNGTASCWDALSGTVVWSERLSGHYSASPLLADGKLYFFSEEGKTTVVKAERQFSKIAENELPDGFMASPAVSGKALFLRTKKALYRIEP